MLGQRVWETHSLHAELPQRALRQPHAFACIRPVLSWVGGFPVSRGSWALVQPVLSRVRGLGLARCPVDHSTCAGLGPRPGLRFQGLVHPVPSWVAGCLVWESLRLIFPELSCVGGSWPAGGPGDLFSLGWAGSEGSQPEDS